MISGRMVEHAHKEDCWEAFALPTVDPKVTAFNEMTAKALLQVAPLYTMSLHQAREQRAQWARRAATGYGGYRTLIPDAPGLRARELRAEPARGLYLHIHGGGWVLGGPDQQDELLGELRDRAGVSVLSVAYRLAPEHPFPAAVEDVEAALRWALEQGLEELGASALVLGGESAGANLAVAALTRLRQHRDIHKVRAVCLNYGTFDLAGTPSLLAAPPGSPFLDRELAAWFRGHYAPAALHRHPEVSPLYADLSGLPPARFLVGTADPVRDDTLFMYARWRAAGSPARLCVLPGGLHGLLEWKTPLTKPARADLAQFVREALDG